MINNSDNVPLLLLKDKKIALVNLHDLCHSDRECQHLAWQCDLLWKKCAPGLGFIPGKDGSAYRDLIRKNKVVGALPYAVDQKIKKQQKVVALQNELLGFCYYNRDAQRIFPTLTIFQLCVLPEYRRKYIATSLLCQVLGNFKEEYLEMKVKARVREDLDANHFWRSYFDCAATVKGNNKSGLRINLYERKFPTDMLSLIEKEAQ